MRIPECRRLTARRLGWSYRIWDRRTNQQVRHPGQARPSARRSGIHSHWQ